MSRIWSSSPRATSSPVQRPEERACTPRATPRPPAEFGSFPTSAQRTFVRPWFRTRSSSTSANFAIVRRPASTVALPRFWKLMSIVAPASCARRDDLHERRVVLRPLGKRAVPVPVPVVVVEDPHELRLERLHLLLDVAVAAFRRPRRDRRVEVVVELGAVADERRGRARSRGRARARSPRPCAARRCSSRRSRTAQPSSISTESSADIAVVELHSRELARRAARRHRHRLRLGERGRAEHQPQRGRRTDVPVELGDIRDHVDRPRRERLRRRVDGRDDEIRPQSRDRSPPEQDEPSRAAAPARARWHSPWPLGEPARARFRRPRPARPCCSTRGHLPVHRDMNDTQRLDGRGWCPSVDLDSEQPALWPRERVDLKRVRDIGGGTPHRGHGLRDRGNPNAHASRAARLHIVPVIRLCMSSPSS